MPRPLVGLSEIARMAGVTRQAVSNWQRRHGDFPKPRAKLTSGPVFDVDDVRTWLRQRGLTPKDEVFMATTTRRKQLRHFLYGDQRLIGDFLAQYEGGEFTEEDLRSRSEGTKQAGLDAGIAPVQFRAGGTTGSANERELTLRQTMPSQFSRLYDLMSDDDLIQPLFGFDEAIWQQVEPGTIVEIPVQLRLPGFFQLLQIASGMTAMMPLMSQMGTPVSTDPQALVVMQFLAKMSGELETRPATMLATAVALPKVKLMCQLSREFLRVPINAVEGEATMLAKVQRKLRRGEQVSAIEFPALDRLSGAQRKQLVEVFDKPDIPGFNIGESTVGYPGAVVAVVALYQ